MNSCLDSLPRRIFLDSCTAQTLLNYGRYIFEAEEIAQTDRIHRVSDGIANVEALRWIFLVNERALFEWIVSHGSLQEGINKRDPGQYQWFRDIADRSDICLDGDGPTFESRLTAARLDDPSFNYLGDKDRLLLKHAIFLRCETFLTMERRLPCNAGHIQHELGLRIMTPSTHWELLRPWAALWC
jgi:hypothetical protein